MVWAVARRPVLLWEALRAAWSMRRRGWITPASEYIAWRTHTAYGAGANRWRSQDVVHYLYWRREMRRARGREPR